MHGTIVHNRTGALTWHSNPGLATPWGPKQARLPKGAELSQSTGSFNWHSTVHLLPAHVDLHSPLTCTPNAAASSWARAT